MTGKRYGKILAVVCTLLLSGCGSMRVLISETKVNTGVFQNSDEIMERLQMIKTDIDAGKTLFRKDALSRVGLSETTPNLENLRRDVLTLYLYGAGMVIPSTREAKEELSVLSGVQIPFTFRQRKAVLEAPFYVRSFESGYDLAIVFIFSNGRLTSAQHFGILAINRETREILWNPFSSISASATNVTTKK